MKKREELYEQDHACLVDQNPFDKGMHLTIVGPSPSNLLLLRLGGANEGGGGIPISSDGRLFFGGCVCKTNICINETKQYITPTINSIAYGILYLSRRFLRGFIPP